MATSAGCWAKFGALLAREFQDPAYFALHQMTVDAYAASHPGGQDRRAVQTTGLHLMTLQLFIEEGIDVGEGPRLHKRMVRRPPEFRWLKPPDWRGSMTVADVVKASSAGEHLALVQAWSEDIWATWADHHATVREWVSKSLG